MLAAPNSVLLIVQVTELVTMAHAHATLDGEVLHAALFIILATALAIPLMDCELFFFVLFFSFFHCFFSLMLLLFFFINVVFFKMQHNLWQVYLLWHLLWKLVHQT